MKTRSEWIPSLAGRLLRYAWASPATLVGLALAGIACSLGATARLREGVVEVAGGRLTRLLGSSFPFSFIAITFGHVVLGITHGVLARERGHEHAHVRQYERWGILFFPLYVVSSGLQLIAGRDPYLGNTFELQARVSTRNPIFRRRDKS